MSKPRRRPPAPFYLAALAGVVGLGLASRLRPVGWPPYDHSLGDVLYAVAAYLTLALLLPRRGPVVVGALALTACLAVESFQATGIPARHADWLLVRWLMGTTFSWHDVGCYLVGGITATALDFAFRRALLRERRP